jgi:hypothetical protein
VSGRVGIIGLTVDATDVQQFPFGIFLELVRGLNEPPRVRGVDTVVPGLAGRIARNRTGDGFILELHGYVAGLGTSGYAQGASWRDQVNTFRVLFDPTQDPVGVVATLEDGSTATCSARTLPTVVWVQRAPTCAEVSVEMESLDTDWVIEPAP